MLPPGPSLVKADETRANIGHEKLFDKIGMFLELPKEALAEFDDDIDVRQIIPQVTSIADIEDDRSFELRFEPGLEPRELLREV